MALGPLAILVQQNWGGAYGDSAAESEAWRALIDHVNEVIEPFSQTARPRRRQREILLTASNLPTKGYVFEVFKNGDWFKLIETENWNDVLDERDTSQSLSDQ
jgi:hypothetical protein